VQKETHQKIIHCRFPRDAHYHRRPRHRPPPSPQKKSGPPYQPVPPRHPPQSTSSASPTPSSALGHPQRPAHHKRQPDINDTTELTSDPSETEDVRYSPRKAMTSTSFAYGRMVEFTQQWAMVDASTASHSSLTISDASCRWEAAPSWTPRITACGALARARRILGA